MRMLFLLLVALSVLSPPINSVAQVLATAPEASAEGGAPGSAIPKACQTGARISGPVAEVLKTLSNHPTAQGYNTLGALYGETSQLDCAIAAFESALKLDPNSSKARYNLPLALVSHQDYKKAVEQLEIVIREHPDFFAAHNALGVAYRSLGQLDAAAEEFQNTLKIDPKFVGASLNLAEVDQDQGRYAAAIYYLQQVLAQSPPSEMAERLQMDLAVAYSQSGTYDDAALVFKKLILLHPNSAQLHFILRPLTRNMRSMLKLQPHISKSHALIRRMIAQGYL